MKRRRKRKGSIDRSRKCGVDRTDHSIDGGRRRRECSIMNSNRESQQPSDVVVVEIVEIVGFFFGRYNYRYILTLYVILLSYR
jgi:hypothetical protein